MVGASRMGMRCGPEINIHVLHRNVSKQAAGTIASKQKRTLADSPIPKVLSVFLRF